ncbi:carboxypeptidase-like regulatory domain-containing protein [Cytophagaceae bacterium YF14B1]|uniref:Carboxypeptidase-like regulatory domain-containing protein n=1 Tax=Xanthocytophaga flava TaxID=3048013 RepID=A0AAE3QT80_9BACT|nr:carboxypeptidase-like regulatory domain-containing protein [Xanthocytophaga flavus]MDJ1482258.1 carboxypeptidase-like regulatory domain-containing protein [Xanthocytophaga flavus]
MKNTISLSVANPCTEKWEHFTPTSQGGFCSSCSKNVIDFTQMSDQEVLDFFKNKPAYTCGRFRPDQLKTYAVKNRSVTRPRRSLVQAGALGLLLLFADKHGYSQNLSKKTFASVQLPQEHTEKDISDNPGHTIGGIVKGDNNEPLPGVSIVLKGSSIGTSTDATGRFQFPKDLKEGDVLIFSFIGYEMREYVITKNIPTTFEMTLSLDIVPLMGAVAVDNHYQAKPSGLSNFWQKVKSIF